MKGQLQLRNIPAVLSRTTHVSQGQEDEQLPFYLPLWAFSVENVSSLREPTALDTSGRLLQQFCADGFVTTGNPIMIRMEEGAVKLGRFII